MSVIQRLTPINLLEEKEKIFTDNTYNPQFLYGDDITDIKLTKYGKPKTEHLTLAQHILERAYFGRNDQDLSMMEGPEVDQNTVNEKISNFLKMHQLENRYSIMWSASFVSRTSIDRETIKIRLPVAFRRYSLLGMIYHEIGTHALRQINYEQQAWYKKKQEFGLTHNYLKTEEGLAVLHSLLPQHFKLAYKPARYYVAVAFAQEHSFAQMWQLLTPIIPNPEKRWTTIVRQKRGLTDTSQPGGYTKDLVYFSGLLQTWAWLKKHDFTITDLYLGKIATQDTVQAKQLSPYYQPILPRFFSVNTDQYAKNVANIGTENGLDQLTL